MQTTIENVILHYDIVGADSHDPILFLHGFPLAGEMWRATAERIHTDGWRCIIPDLRGHGRSDATAEVSIQAFADDLAGLLENIGESRPVVLCGLSMGGVIAFEFYRRHNERVRALILCDCRATPETETGKAERLDVAHRVLEHGSPVIANEMITTLIAPSQNKPLREYWRDLMSSTNPIGVAAALRALAERPDSTATLAKIDVPTLLVFGARDVITPPDVGRQMQAAIPNARLELIPNAGHLPPIEQTDPYVEVLRQFLSEL